MKNFFILFYLLFAISSFSQEKEAITNPDVMPEYPGGPSEMMKFISGNLKYPETEKRENKGSFGCKTIIEFTVDKTGKVKNVFVARSCVGCNACDTEAIKVFEKMPSWKPGLQNNKPIDVKMGMPVFFTFK